MKVNIIGIVLSLLCIVNFTGVSWSKTITEQDAIKISLKIAKKNKYDTKNKSVETLLVKDGHERGPVRLSWVVMRLSSKNDIIKIMNSKFWIIYFYSKSDFESRSVLDGCFCSLVDINTGKVILYFND